MLPSAHRQKKQHPMLLLLHAVSRPETVHDADVPTGRFRAAVRAAGIGADHDIPHVEAALIRKYATDLRALKLI